MTHDGIIYPESPHGLQFSETQAKRYRERFEQEGLPVYSAARYVDLPFHEKRDARREFMAFGTGPYASRMAMLDEFDRLTGPIAADFPTVVEVWGDAEPIDWREAKVNL